MPADIRRAVSADLEYDEGEPIEGVAVDLNGDAINDYLLQSAPRLCGNGGCVYVVCDGATERKLGQFFGSPLYVRAEFAHGYPNIATYSHQNAGSGTYTDYSFNGKAYIVTSARTVRGQRRTGCSRRCAASSLAATPVIVHMRNWGLTAHAPDGAQGMTSAPPVMRGRWAAACPRIVSEN